jgi:hypothetical protein
MSKPIVSIIFSSRNDGPANEGFIKHVQDTCGYDAHIFHIHNPTGVALTKIYSDLMTSENNQSDIDIFIHDDIEFLKPGWGKEIVRLFRENKEYGIIGVAGSAQFDENAAWWNYKKKYGQVLHRSNGKSWLTAFSPLLDKDLEEVCVIDGLFIAVNKKRVSKGFDKELEGFDFYDIDFCLANYLDGKCKIGVTTNIRLAHNSVGELKESWYKNRDKVIEKFGDNFPIDVDGKKQNGHEKKDK